MQQNPSTTAELLEAAKVAEATVVESGPSVSSEILDAINRLEQRVAASVDDNRPPGNRRQSWSPAPFGRSTSTLRQRVRFDDRRQLPSFGGYGSTTAQQYGQQSPQRLPPSSPGTPSRRFPSSTSVQPVATGCTNCARVHDRGLFPARGKFCRCCGKPNHFAVCCRSRRQRE